MNTPPPDFPKGKLAVVVTGGRDFSDGELVCAVLDDLDVAVLIHGACTGADSMADRWAVISGIKPIPFPVTSDEWRRIGRRAGPLRNGRMIAETVATIAPAYGATPVLVAFHGGRGTKNCIDTARAASVAVWEVEP